MKQRFSAQTLNKVEAAKRYIEHRHAMLLQYHKRKHDLWEELSERMRRMRMPLEEQRRLKMRLSREEGGVMRQWRRIPTEEEFERVRVVGRGAFGEVVLCRGPRGETVALKQMDKQLIKQQIKYRQIREERNLHVLTHPSRWIVKLKYCFESRTQLFLAMEYMPGGDLMGLLMKEETLPHKSAQFYAAEIVLALEEVHSMGFIHRDVKPDNLLIDANGHLKLTDFGLCRQFKEGRDRVHSAVGTKGYVAPQVCTSQEYTQTADWWSLGVIIFQMLVGYAPFTTSSATETIQRTLAYQTNLIFPQQISYAAKDLICKLITRKDKRIGLNQIKSHPFFLGVVWEQLHEREAPFVPSLSSRWDTRYFQKYLELQRGSVAQSQVDEEMRFPGYAFNESQYSNRIIERLLVELNKKSELMKSESTEELLFQTASSSLNNLDKTRHPHLYANQEQDLLPFNSQDFNQSKFLFQSNDEEEEEIDLTVCKGVPNKNNCIYHANRWKESINKNKSKNKLIFTPQKIRFQSSGQKILTNNFKSQEKECLNRNKLG